MFYQLVPCLYLPKHLWSPHHFDVALSRVASIMNNTILCSLGQVEKEVKVHARMRFKEM